MSIADTQKVKELERKVSELEARLLLLEMQKRPVEPVRNTLTLPRKAAA